MGPGEALLAAAEREIGRGNHLRGAELVWQATMEAVSAAAARHGMPCRDREEARRFVKHLDNRDGQLGAGFETGLAGGIISADQQTDQPGAEGALQFPHYNLAAFSTAESFREHYESREELEGSEFQWEPDEYAVFLDPVRGFVASLNRR